MPQPATAHAPRILSGVQPSGVLHLGNYFGAMAQHIAMQDDGEVYIFIADLHALTTVQDPQRMRELTRGVAMDYLALGLDPNRTVFYRQSDVPEVTELAWHFACVTGMGLLERAHSYKDKVARGITPSVGLFYYPVLMAADILIVKADVVPVGPDQQQHLEMTRDMAKHFNERFGETFPLPRERFEVTTAVPGTDGAKMSKSFSNTIEIFADAASLKKVINKKIVTDSRGVDEPKDPATCTPWQLYALVAPDEAAAIADQFAAGGIGYGDVKKRLLNALLERFDEPRRRREELARDPDGVEAVLRDGARRAREVTSEVMDDVRRKTGYRS